LPPLENAYGKIQTNADALYVLLSAKIRNLDIYVLLSLCESQGKCAVIVLVRTFEVAFAESYRAAVIR
jgi:hypothetical protein